MAQLGPAARRWATRRGRGGQRPATGDDRPVRLELKVTELDGRRASGWTSSWCRPSSIAEQSDDAVEPAPATRNRSDGRRRRGTMTRHVLRHATVPACSPSPSPPPTRCTWATTWGRCGSGCRCRTTYEAFYGVADLHALTVETRTRPLRRNRSLRQRGPAARRRDRPAAVHRLPAVARARAHPAQPGSSAA